MTQELVYGPTHPLPERWKAASLISFSLSKNSAEPRWLQNSMSGIQGKQPSAASLAVHFMVCVSHLLPSDSPGGEHQTSFPYGPTGTLREGDWALFNVGARTVQVPSEKVDPRSKI